MLLVRHPLPRPPARRCLGPPPGRVRQLGRRVGRGRPTSQAVAAFYPLAWVTERVAGDGVGGHQPHPARRRAARPRARASRQTADLDEADLVVFEHEFQPAVDEAIEQRRRTRSWSTPPRPWSCARSRSSTRATSTPGGGALRGRRARPRRRRPALLAGPAADGRPRRRGRRRPGRGRRRGRDDVPQQRRRPARRPRGRSTASSPRASPRASATPWSSATRRSATSSATGCTSRASPACPPTPSRRPPCWPSSRT